MIRLVDCTLRDGGYYNHWDFEPKMVEDYLRTMKSISVDYVELGFRTLSRQGYKGGCGYTTETYIRDLSIPSGIKLGVMVNAKELIEYPEGVVKALQKLFAPASNSSVSLVRIACHMHEIEPIMPGCVWLKENGYIVTINFMQIADRDTDEICTIAKLVNNYPLDVLYFADSMGGLSPDQTAGILQTLRKYWKGEIGIHTHDNMGAGLANSMRAIKEGATWVDGTVSGMGRGPGNTKTEYLVIELESYRNVPCSLTPLLGLIKRYFKPMQAQFSWGTNAYYYLAGKYGIHPTYIQEMLNDARYNEEDIIAVIDYLKSVGKNKFSLSTLQAARQFYGNEPRGTWCPATLIAGKDVLILGTGPGVLAHKRAIEAYIRAWRPFVIALNTKSDIDGDLIDIRAACHPMRLLAECALHVQLPQPLITPASMLPKRVAQALAGKQLLDYGLSVEENAFGFAPTHCTLPSSQVIAYALAVATSGKASRILLSGFDGHGADDPRTAEMEALLSRYQSTPGALPLLSITPTQYSIPMTSVYAMSEIKS